MPAAHDPAEESPAAKPRQGSIKVKQTPKLAVKKPAAKKATAKKATAKKATAKKATAKKATAAETKVTQPKRARQEPIKVKPRPKLTARKARSR